MGTLGERATYFMTYAASVYEACMRTLPMSFWFQRIIASMSGTSTLVSSTY